MACFFVPIFYLEVYKKRASKKFEKKFSDLALTHNITLSKFNSWRNLYAIGIDYKKGYLLYLNNENDQGDIRLIKLSEVSRCRIFKKENIIKSQKPDFKVITNLGIVISYLNSSKPELKLEFYRDENGNTLGDEINMAEKWAGLIKTN